MSVSTRFLGKSVIVTGSASGIGRAAALCFAEEGANLIVADVDERLGRETTAMIRDAGGNAHFVMTDVSRNDDCREMVSKAIKEFGALDIAFNNAGIGESGFSLADEPEDVFDRLIAINLKGVFLSMRHEIAAMKGRGGVIVNTSSVSAFVGFPGSSTYTAAKHGVVGLTRAAALDHIGHGIRINAICPGGTRTPLLETWFKNSGAEERITAMHPIGRMADPREIARAVLFLASDDSSFMVGTTITTDGEFTAM